MRSSPRYFWAVIFLFGLTLTAAEVARRRSPDRLIQPLDTIPTQINGWVGRNAPRFSENIEGVLGATSYLSRDYRSGDRQLSLLVSYYAQQNAGESMHSPRNCLPGTGWEAQELKSVTVPLPSGPVDVNLYQVRKNAEGMEVLYWYQSRKRIVASEYAGKAYLIWDALKYGSSSGALVRLTMPKGADAVEREIEFARHIIPEVQRCLGN